jgi:hypothetical protein
LEELIKVNKGIFRNLNDYEIINISGVENPNAYKSPTEIKAAIRKFESEGKKTITLTVNRMLTGSTVPEWDTMLYLKDTSSPQEYDQAIFRLQNQYIKTYKDKDGKIIKYNMKPQTLLVDFDPNRMFEMQERKAQIYNVNVDDSGNSKLAERLKKELEISPIVTINSNKIVEVTATNIMEAISAYNHDKGFKDEALEIPVDLSILSNELVRNAIEQENEIGAKSGLSNPAYEGKDNKDGDDLDISAAEPTDSEQNGQQPSFPISPDNKKNEELSLKKKIQSYYARILMFAFLTNDKVISLANIIKCINKVNNVRISKNLGLQASVLNAFSKTYNKWALRSLDYKIQDINSLNYAELPVEDKIKVAFKKFGKLGDSIVVTPSNICDDMVALLPDECLLNLPKTGGKILDIAGVSGEFAAAIYKRMTALGVKKNYIANAIYTIPKSPVCYEFIRKLYKILGLNINNIAEQFNAYDLLSVTEKDKINYTKICDILSQDKPFNTITLQDEVPQGERKVKFEAVIGNPPYQLDSHNTSDTPVYHIFMNLGFSLSKRATFITPGRFLFNAGKTPKDWNQRVLKDKHFKVVWYKANSVEVFPSVDIKGGVAVTYRDSNMDFGSIGVYTAFEQLNAILSKVLNCGKFVSLSSLIYAPESYKFTQKLHAENPWAVERLSDGHAYDITTNIFDKLPELFLEDKPAHGNFVGIYGRKNNDRVIRWIKKEYVCDHENLMKYKVIVPKANGSGALGEELSTPVIGHTQTFISIGAFNTQYEAESLLKYCKGKFARCMLGILKVTQDNKKSTWEFVPMQDFTEHSDIDWSKSIPEIDAQLYRKYALTPDEITFIESMIKPME